MEHRTADAGFAPADLTEAYDRAATAKAADKAIQTRRLKLLQRAFTANQMGDIDGLLDVMKSIDKFNAKNPEPSVRITPRVMARSSRARLAESLQAYKGVVLSKGLRNRLKWQTDNETLVDD